MPTWWWAPTCRAYVRRDKAHVSDAAQRPTDEEYDRYLWLAEEAKRAGYDAGLLRESGSFQVGDVLFTAIFAAAERPARQARASVAKTGRRRGAP